MASNSDTQRAFFQFAFGRQEQGFACLAFLEPGTKDFTETFYEWPAQLDKMVQDIGKKVMTHNVYFCPQLLESRKRHKDNIKICPTAWSDLDTCTPDKLQLEPQMVITSSPGRYQALWRFREPLPGVSAEEISRRIAYYHASHGADRSGWDLTQLLRVPGTYNYKYGKTITDAPLISYKLGTRQTLYEPKEFSIYPPVKGTKELTLPLPESLPEEAPEEIMQRYRLRMNPLAFGLFSTEPHSDWSATLWKLLMFLFEAGMHREEVYAVALKAECNKYARDNKPPEYLWRDICRAYLRHKENVESVVTTHDLDKLLTDQELRDADRNDTFVERYITWASGLGDAATQYHQAGAFVILSSLLAGNVKLPTSFGTILPNLWFMILADTTLTRKSTAMDIAMDLVDEVDPDILLATDGSIEGLLTAMSMRSGRPSVFLRDEFSGLLEMMTKKDYYSGMGELLTKLYDGKTQKRILRRETITVEKPVLVLFAGGIKQRIQGLLTLEDISSGFIPRFLFVTAESDVRRVQALGPPSERDMSARESILTNMRDLVEFYHASEATVSNAGYKVSKPKQFNAYLTQDAWKRYNKLESDLLKAGLQIEKPELMTPLYSRLAISILKAATLIAASRQKEDRVEVSEADIAHAIKYGEGWREYANDVVNNIGKTSSERNLERILKAIVGSPGITRSRLMQYYHLTAREADAIFSTLEQRGVITRTQTGRAAAYHPVVGVT